MPVRDNDPYITCPSHRTGDPMIQWIKMGAGDILESSPDIHWVIFLISGKVELTCGDAGKYAMPAGSVFILPYATGYRMYTSQNCTLLKLRIEPNACLCQEVSLRDLADRSEEPAQPGLVMKEPILGTIRAMIELVKKGIGCPYYHDLKIKEVLYLLRLFYSPSELSRLFAPLLGSSHTSFAEFVLTRYRHYRTVQELVSVSGYAPSSFNKLFRKTFGQSPYQWMKEQKARQIYIDIRMSSRNFKDLAVEHGFRSLSHFTNFCKSEFGHGPRNIRKMQASVSSPARSELSTCSPKSSTL